METLGRCGLVDCNMDGQWIVLSILAAMTLYGIWLYYRPFWLARRAGLSWRQIRRNRQAMRQRAHLSWRDGPPRPPGPVYTPDNPRELDVSLTLDGTWQIENSEQNRTVFRMICMLLGGYVLLMLPFFAVIGVALGIWKALG